MGIPHEMRPDMSVTDLAYFILKNRGQTLHFKELIAEIMRIKAIGPENPGRLIAQMHTEINLDSRFLHQGSGEWGLREWQPKSAKVVRLRPETPAAPATRRSGLRGDEEEDEDFGYDEEPEEEEDLTSDETDDQFESEGDDPYGDDD